MNFSSSRNSPLSNVMDTPDALMYKLTSLIEETDEIAKRLIGINRSIFGKTHLRNPKLTPPELGFVRCTSYVYALLWDGARSDLEFLQDTYASSVSGTTQFLSSLNNLRTYLQHRLYYTESTDRARIEECESWFKANCGTPIPESDGHWMDCLCSFIKAASEYLTLILGKVRQIEKDGTPHEIILQWEVYVKRHPKPHYFDEIIRNAALDMGRDHIDATKIRNKNHAKWLKHLEAMPGNFDLNDLLRRMAEKAILEQTVDLMPISGDDIMMTLGLEPGPKIGVLLGNAREIFTTDRNISKSELLKKLEVMCL